ncbi:MAG: hypothetical protein EHM43_00850 [Ignavibacteriae bacterium]|nr:MAG: hypothetical protein EHM43_00850 [Ignavibacteriota bacterium]
MVRQTLSLLAILILASGLAARTHTVRPGPGAVAKAFATVSSGDTVLITTGTYYETDLRVLVPGVILGQE